MLSSAMKNPTAMAITFSLVMLGGCKQQSAQALAHRRSTRPHPRALRSTGQAPAFDYYLLNLSWSPEFCYSHPSAAECAQHRAFTLHGLWPQNMDGTYPENCSNSSGPTNPSQYSDIYPDIHLLEHEWQTHGTCSGLAPDAFLQLTRKAVHSVAIPAQLTSLGRQTSMRPSQILDLFVQANPSIPRASLALSCGNNYLTAIEVCMNRSLQPHACGPIRTCRANTVRIPPP